MEASELNAPKIKNQYARYVRMTLYWYTKGTRRTDQNLDEVIQKNAKLLNDYDIKHLAAYIQSI